MSKANDKEEKRIDAPYHNQFFRIADMLATPCADKRVDALSTMSEARGFSINEIIKFVEHWITTQSKFPVLADIYAFTGKSIKQDKECDHKFYMPISKDWFFSYRDDGMRRLKAFCIMIDDFNEKNIDKSWCCYFNKNEDKYYQLCDDQKFNYVGTTLEEIEFAYNVAEKKLNKFQKSIYQPKNERGFKND